MSLKLSFLSRTTPRETCCRVTVMPISAALDPDGIEAIFDSDALQTPVFVAARLRWVSTALLGRPLYQGASELALGDRAETDRHVRDDSNCVAT